MPRFMSEGYPSLPIPSPPLKSLFAETEVEHVYIHFIPLVENFA